MKKTIVFALLVALLISLAVPAMAAGTASAGGNAGDLVPGVVPDAPAQDDADEEEDSFVVSTENNEWKLVSAEDADTLEEKDQENFAAAKDALEEALPEGMAAKYFFYWICEDASDVTFDLELFVDQKYYEGTEEYEDLVIKQYVDGQWVELEFELNEDGTVTVRGVVNGPIAIFVKTEE